MRKLFAVVCLFLLCSSWTLAKPRQSPQPQGGPGTGGAQHPNANPIPDTFMNLQVLPKDIKKPQLMNVMKDFCTTFKVRCAYCHAVSDDLTQGSFDSDEKETKQKARELLKAIIEIKPMKAPGDTTANGAK